MTNSAKFWLDRLGQIRSNFSRDQLDRIRPYFSRGWLGQSWTNF